MKAFRVTVPGNLLLSGEYAILEENGLGVALACQNALQARIEKAPQFTIESCFPLGNEIWKPETHGINSQIMLQALFQHLWIDYFANKKLRLPEVKITLDSKNLYDSQGRKKGFGSSAALTVALTIILANLEGRKDIGELAMTAVNAHRFIQGGKGSGYDIFTSFYGGMGLFAGGKLPTWQQCSIPNEITFFLFPGAQAVKTTSSIKLYSQWKASHSIEASNYIESSNKASFLLAQSNGDDFLKAFTQCANLGIKLGECIGSSALMETPKLKDFQEMKLNGNLVIKASGAGNETGIAAFNSNYKFEDIPKEWEPLHHSSQGVFVWD